MKLTDLMSAEQLQKLQDLFASLSDTAVLMTDERGTAVTKGSHFCRFCSLTRQSPAGAAKCEESDGQGGIVTIESGHISLYHCHAGFLDYAVPIMLNEECVGSIVGGQVRTDEVDEEQVREAARRYGLDPEEYVREAHLATRVDEKRLEGTLHFMADLSSYVVGVAYERYLIMKENQRVLREADSQSRLLIQLNNQLQQKISALSGHLGNDTHFAGEPHGGEPLRDLLVQTASLSGMVEDTYDYMHMSDSALELIETPYEVHYTISGEIRKRKAGHPELDERLTFEVDAGMPPYLLGDPVRIGQIVMRLIDFDLRRSDSDRIHLFVSSRRESYASMLEMCFRYEGSCLGEEELKRVRSALQDSGDSLIERQEYEYIGLSVAAWLVRRMSGRIRADNTGDRSWEFRLTIPQLGTKGSDY